MSKDKNNGNQSSKKENEKEKNGNKKNKDEKLNKEQQNDTKQEKYKKNKEKDAKDQENKEKPESKKAFFKIDKDKVKLHFKSIGDKFSTNKRRKRGIIILLCFFLLAGASYAFLSYDQPSDEFIQYGEDEITEFIEQENDLQEFPQTEEREIDDEVDFPQLTEEQEQYEEIEEDFVPEPDEPEDSELPPAAETEVETDTDEQVEPDTDRETAADEPITEDTEIDETEDVEPDQVTGVVTEPVESTVTEETGADAAYIDILKPIGGEIVREQGWFHHPVFDDWRYQNGVKIANESGTIVMAADSGTISSVYNDDYKGVVVEIEHDDGWKTLYGHLQDVSVSAGEVVGKGQEIGKVGETGVTTRPALYFELKNERQPVNPADYFQ